MNCQIREVECMAGQRLWLRFKDGSCKVYDMHILYDLYPEYKQLEEGDLFSTAYVDSGGFSVVWGEDIICLACEELYYNGVAAP